MRRIVSAGGNRNVTSGRISKSGVESAQRSPINLNGFADAGAFMEHDDMIDRITNHANTHLGGSSQKEVLLKTSFAPTNFQQVTIWNDATEHGSTSVTNPTAKPPVLQSSSASPITDVRTRKSEQEMSENSQNEADSVDGSIDNSTWENLSEVKYEAAITKEAARQLSVLLSLAGAVRYRLLSKLMLAFHSRMKEISIAPTANCCADSPSTNHSAGRSSASDTPAGGSSSLSSTSASSGGGTSNPLSSGDINKKRGVDGDEQGRRNSKKPRRESSNSPSTPPDPPKYPCPYQKREPNSFGQSARDVCAGHWPSIAKLK